MVNPTQDALIARTLEHYSNSAESFWEGTKDHDVDQNRLALLDELDGPPPHAILDVGCGPGRDLAWFSGRGHDAVGVEGAPEMARMARDMTGCQVLQQNFLSLDLPADRFDGIFANASLFHVPKSDLSRVLGELRAALKPRGVLFTSNPRGDNTEVMNGERFCSFHDYETWRDYVAGVGFEEIRHYYRPEGKPRVEQPWLASVWRRIEDPNLDKNRS
ncbi:MAG: class I SAM-dependent methyltransferase [Rhodospirillales bacterium]|nr:class I SAM-dependent methyltransferase [Rhodospirillales bacterium]